MEERRRARRVPVRLDAAYEDADGQVFLRSRDVSESGIFLLSQDPPGEGRAAHVLLELPGQEEFLRLHGVVTRTQAEPRGFALHFDGSSREAGRRALRRFVEGRKPPARAAPGSPRHGPPDRADQ